MENQVEKFDPSKLMDGVKDRIKATFVSLIPDEQWETMCDTEMKKFFEPIYSGYNKQDKGPSEFEKIVMELMRERCKEYLKELFDKPKYSVATVWGNSQHGLNGSGQRFELSDHLDTMVKEKMPDMMQAIFMQTMSNAFYQFFAQAQNQIR